MYAVVQLQGHQYIVSEGDVITVDQIDTDKKTYETSDVLAVFDESGKGVVLGTPHVKGGTVTFAVQEHKQGDKIHVYKFKNKNRYSRKTGFRPQQTVLAVNKIAYGS
ncbi:MAG: 50S ribosomal protein L21 [Candidatus Peribacteria bacterium]|nr:MAG: 50S ribosomal protein L21 [Candidatus Peribacteria bacterium]